VIIKVLPGAEPPVDAHFGKKGVAASYQHRKPRLKDEGRLARVKCREGLASGSHQRLHSGKQGKDPKNWGGGGRV